MNNKSLKIMIVLFLIVLICSLTYVGYILYGYHTSDLEYEAIHNTYITFDSKNTESSNNETGNQHDNDTSIVFPNINIDIDGLMTVNPDFVCWIYYKDGNVSYPVVKEQSNDIDGYLHRTFEGKSSSAGCLFIPYDASDDFTNLNTFIYGHNMRKGSMFGSLKFLYNNPAGYFKEPYFYIWTKNHERIMYRVISVYVVDKDSNMYAIPSGKSAYNEYLNDALKFGSTGNRISFTDEELQAMNSISPILTLSACYGAAGTHNRLLVQGVEVFRESFK